MDKRDYVIIWLSLQLVINGALWMRAEKNVARLEGNDQVYKWAQEAADHACGEYEQPVHSNFRKGGLTNGK
jgi:hypothetical protein